MKSTGLVLVLCGLLLASQAGATEIFEKVGTVGGQFLKIGVGTRAAGMGDAFTSVADDASDGLGGGQLRTTKPTIRATKLKMKPNMCSSAAIRESTAAAAWFSDR